MATVYLALGSNLGNSKLHIDKAIDILQDSIKEIKRASMYTSKAIGYTDQPDFFNTVIRGITNLNPTELLNFVKSTEKKVGRIERFRWGPREIDIDIIFYDDLILKSDALQIPHPNFMDRDFVLQPLTDLDPELIDPLSKQSIKNILVKLDTKHASHLRRLTKTEKTDTITP